MGSGVELTIVAETLKFNHGDDRWMDQVSTLHAALRTDTGGTFLRGVPEPGMKGTADTVILALGSSGALTAAVACFRAWLARDKTRTLTVTWIDDSGTDQTIKVSGSNIDQTSFRTLTNAVSKRLEAR